MDDLLLHFEEALDAWTEPLFLINGNMECVYANVAFCQIVGLSTSSREIFPIDQYWPSVRNADWRCEECVTEFIHSSGAPMVVKILSSSCGEGHHLCRIVGATSKDETVINFHTQRLETLGMLAGGVAHDFNNILTGILGHITYLKTILPSAGNHVESLTAIEDGARRASTMTQQILDFSRLEVSDKAEPINLVALIARTCTLLRGAISPRYEMEWKLPRHDMLALVEESKMAQVLINLAINSRDAIEPGGFIHISLDVAEDDAIVKKAFGNAELLAQHYACLCVEDSGHGIPETVLNRVFEPYFTTKKGKGTGLGLATVKAIVRLFGGAISIDSKEEEGTSVQVFLPLLDESLQTSRKGRAKRVEARSGLLGGTERILIVDDEQPVRNVLCVSLEHLGYSVEAVASGPEALELVKVDPKAYDLVILDMLMPHMSGKEVFCELKALNADIRVLAISGFTSEESIRYILDNGGKGFVQKPFTIEDLSVKVRACF